MFIRPWRSWISQQIPILEAGGSNPSGRAKKEDLIVRWGLLFLYLHEGFEPERVGALRKLSGREFLATSGESGTEREALGRRTSSLRSRRSNPSGRAKTKILSILVGRIFVLYFSFFIFHFSLFNIHHSTGFSMNNE